MDFTSLKAFECRLEDGLFHLTLNRPEAGNVFGADFCAELNAIVNEISSRADVRAILMTSRGRFFSVGGDIGLMSTERAALPGIVRSLTSPLHMAIGRLMCMNAPTVCAVHGGGAFGGAVALLAAADVVIAGDSTKFGAAFTGIGFSCDSGSTVALTHRMGVARAKRFILLSETLNAEAAQQAGLVDIIAPEANLAEQAASVARKLATGPTRAYGEIKRLFLHVTTRAAPSQMEEEAQALAYIARTDDAWEGLNSFREKRPARFTGG